MVHQKNRSFEKGVLAVSKFKGYKTKVICVNHPATFSYFGINIDEQIEDILKEL